MKKIAVFTGSRANYSSTKTILKELAASKTIKLINIVGGAATLQRFGEWGSWILWPCWAFGQLGPILDLHAGRCSHS